MENKTIKTCAGLALAVVLVSACGGSNGSGSMIPDSTPMADADGGPSSDPGKTDPVDEPPHALGTIVLGEAHASGASTPSPIVSVSFLPDAKLASQCKTTLEGCELSLTPKCKEVVGITGCATGQACTFDTACAPICKTVPEKPEKPESFDAGPIAFGGTTTPITLYPPYVFESDGKGAPFLAGSEIRVQAQGAAQAGFMAFDEKFTGTTFLQTMPSLKDVPRENLFGTGPLTLAWVAGKDEVVVTLSGPAGSATCKAVDSAGSISVPRAVIDRVLTADGIGTTALGVSIARQRKDTKKDKQAKGMLSDQKVQSVAWLDLVTTSVESASFQGCSAGTAACGDGCVDTKTDKLNCGACNKACAANQQCVAGSCAAVSCVLGPENTLAACSDGCSNDGDPYIDCNDFDCCAVRKDCPPTSSCGKN